MATPFYRDKKNYEFAQYLGESAQALGRYGEAIAYYKDYLTYFGTNLIVLNAIGDCYVQTGDSRRGHHRLDEVARAQPVPARAQEEAGRHPGQDQGERDEMPISGCRRSFAGAVLLVLAACASTRGVKQLDPKSRDFISKVRYTITAEERKAFLALPAEAREPFIEDFWRRRDPTPGTPENEYRTEYYNRIERSNRLFSGGGSPGWLQDRGRVYITLGPPDNRVTYPRGVTFYGLPTEIWWYGLLPPSCSSTSTGTTTTGIAPDSAGADRRDQPGPDRMEPARERMPKAGRGRTTRRHRRASRSRSRSADGGRPASSSSSPTGTSG